MRDNHIITDRGEGNVTIQITSPNGKVHKLVLERNAYNRWMQGAMVQEAFPNLHPDTREILISGYDGEEWDALFGKGGEQNAPKA